MLECSAPVIGSYGDAAHWKLRRRRRNFPPPNLPATFENALFQLSGHERVAGRNILSVLLFNPYFWGEPTVGRPSGG